MNILITGGTGHIGSNCPFNEAGCTDELGLANQYSRTTFMIKQMLQCFVSANLNWRATLLRYFIPIGVNQGGRIGEDPAGLPNNLMPFMAQIAVSTLPTLNICGNDYGASDGGSVRDCSHAVDLAKVTIKKSGWLARH